MVFFGFSTLSQLSVGPVLTQVSGFWVMFTQLELALSIATTKHLLSTM
jgi:hypothetical protein